MALDEGPIVQSALLRGELVRLRKERGLGTTARPRDRRLPTLTAAQGGIPPSTKLDLAPSPGHPAIPRDTSGPGFPASCPPPRPRVRGAPPPATIPPRRLPPTGATTGGPPSRRSPGPPSPGPPRPARAPGGQRFPPPNRPRGPRSVKLRLQRQSYLAQRSSIPRQHYIIDEAVIRRHIGIQTDPGIMPNQLLRIAERAEDDEFIDIRVIPFKTGTHAGLSGPFTLLEFDGGLPDILYLDAGRETIAMKKDDPEVSEYAASFALLLGDALSAQESIAFLREAAEDMG